MQLVVMASIDILTKEPLTIYLYIKPFFWIRRKITQRTTAAASVTQETIVASSGTWRQ